MTIESQPDGYGEPRPNKTNLAERYWKQRSNILIAQKNRTTTNTPTAIYTATPQLGSNWIPIQVSNTKCAKALCVWWNSTPGRLMLLNKRAKTLDFPSWEPVMLRQIKIPVPDNPAWDDLLDAFEQTKNIPLLPLKHGPEDRARGIIDQAAAKALNIDESVIAEWRQRLAKEPTICGKIKESNETK